MKEIQLTQGQVTLVDDDDYNWLSRYSWFAMKRENGKFHAARKHNRRNRYMHQDIMGTPPEGLTIDHEDRNGLNNQRYNLRFITFSENIINSDSRGIGTIEKRGNSYKARIRRENERISLGSYSNEFEARQAVEDFLWARKQF